MSTKSTKKPKLLIELIPKTCWFSNVRTTVKPQQWDKLRFATYEKAKNKCEICGVKKKDLEGRNFLECHEKWVYDDENKIQVLDKLVALCTTCHQTKHIGRARTPKRKKECSDQLKKVNKWKQEDIDKHITESLEVNKERSLHEWTLDLSILNEAPYKLNINLEKKRIFEVQKWKKKKKKKRKIKTKSKRRPKKK